jgi:hypothetical protein
MIPDMSSITMSRRDLVNGIRFYLPVCMVRYLSILALLMGMINSVTAELAGSTNQPFYQIEVIVFANQRNTVGDEKWSIAEPVYPADMLLIGNSTDNLQPLNLGQLKQLDEYKKMLESASADIESTAGENGYLFQSKRRSQGRNTLTDENQSFTEDDLLAGITHEIVQNTATLEQPLGDNMPAEDGVTEHLNQPLTSRRSANLGHLFTAGGESSVFEALAADELTLDNLGKRINRSSNYKLLFHKAWRQHIPPMEKALPALLQGGNRYDGLYELDGYITISRSRYLHIDTNLWYTHFVARGGQSSMIMPDNTQSYPLADRRLLQKYPQVKRYESMRNNYLPAQTYSMIQSRKMRSSTLHYIDHPTFGMLIKIEEYQYPAPASLD